MNESVLHDACSLESLVGRVADEFLQRHKRGEQPDIQDYLQRYPEAAPVLGNVLASLQVLEESLPGSWSGRPGRADDGASGTLGDFRILQEIGRGGMGVVYEAEQISLNRRVAVKVLPFAGALDHKQLQRFKNEAQAAAGLHHTNIVPVHFVGCERGVHFYAMQYIDGRTLAAVIAELRRLAGRDQGGSEAGPELSAAAEALVHGQAAPQPQPANDQCVTIATPPPAPAGTGAAETVAQAATSTGRSVRNPAYFGAVARLGVQAAEALEHAHDMGVIHRDIKPGNLMLDGRGNLWITDFGLAHCQSQAGLTMTGDLVGTLRYMSPEQALAKRVVVDHRTDIYSLGATLYELFTLEPAFAGRDREELLRQIAFEEPKAPRKLNKAIPADLETVVLKALGKNPAERYATAQAVADDLRRFLEHKPIHARRPSFMQRVRKWARRHQALVGAAVGALLLVVAGLAVSTVLIWQEKEETKRAFQKEAAAHDRAEQEKQIAQAVRAFLLNKLLGQADTRMQAESLLLAGRTSAEAKWNPRIGELLDRAAAELSPGKIEVQFPKQPLVQAEILQTMGNTYRAIGAYAPAIAHLRRAKDLRRRELGVDHPLTLATLNDLGESYRHAGNFRQAIRVLDQVWRKRLVILGADQHETLTTLSLLAGAHIYAGNFWEAIRLSKEVWDKRVSKFSHDHPETLFAMNNLAAAYVAAGMWPKGISLLEQVRDQMVKKHGPDHPDTLTTLNNLATAYLDAGKRPEAIRLYQQVRDKRVAKLGPDHPYTLATLNGLARAYLNAGRLRDAIRLFEKVLERQVAKFEPGHLATLTTMNNLACAYREARNLPEAIRLYQQVRNKQVEKFGPNHPDTLAALNNLAAAYVDARNFPQAIKLLEQVRDKVVLKLGPDHPHTLETLNNLAVAYHTAGKLPEAIRLLERVHAKQVANLGRDHPDTLTTLHNVGGMYLKAGRFPEAIRRLEEVRDKEVAKLGPEHPDTLKTLNTLAGAYYEAGSLREAISLWEQVRDKQIATLGPNHPDTLQTLQNLVGGYFKTGRMDDLKGLYAPQKALLGYTLLQRKKYADAEPILRDCLAIRTKKEPDAWTTFNVKSMLGGALLAQKRYADAEPLLLQGFQGMKKRQAKISPQGQVRLTEALERLVQLYDAWGKKDQAARWQKELEAHKKKEKGVKP
jgi:serine/threonine protein kinase/tetratricopeptide (TPR) repeat protein